jgi:glycyl-tRNA synthetase beta chain
VNEDENLLNEVTALVEMPNVLIGKFDEKFLNIPHECLELTMKSNQKYFPVVDANNKITNYFVIVANLSPKNVASIIQGNEKVIRPRLSDAEFFFKKDKEESLSKLAKKLAQVTYHNKLGTQHDRALRVAKIHSYIDKTLQFNNAFDFKKLALASKADLSSLMVGEFPELQGIMGSYYAENDGEEKIFCEAIEDHYSPKFSGDKLPRNSLGLGLALADKIETLISLFSINEIPTGDKDPFALRRAAIGILRILIEKNLALNVIHTIKHFYPNNKNLDELILFIKERLINFLREKKYTPQEVDAVTSNLSNEFNTLLDKLEALQSFVKLDEAAHLAASNKRVANIIKKYQFDNDVKVNKLHLIENEEKILYELLIELDLEVKRDAENKSYIDALSKLVQLKQPIDAFFDKVMVNADDIKLKRNRHNLMLLLHQTFNRVADISKLTT